MKVLIVDDNQSSAEMTSDFLNLYGFEAKVVPDSRQALSVIAAFAPDVVLLDVMMPHIDGITLCKAIKADEKLKTMKVLMLTCRDNNEAREKANQAGADGFLNKTDPAAVLRKLKELH